MVGLNELSEQRIFPKGERIANDHFTGTAWLQILVVDGPVFCCPTFSVTFEPGARNNWHKHPGGLVLLVTGGRRYYPEDGKTAQVIQKGDIIRIPSGIKHWHGAAPDYGMTHIAISTNTERGDAEWLEPVTDEEYRHLKYEERT